MPVNPSEQRFFNELQQQAESNPPKPLSETSIEELRAGGGMFLDLAGNAADIPYMDTTIPVRDGYLVQARIFNPNHDDTKPVFICYPGCGYIFDLFECNAIFASRIAAYADIKVIIPQFRLTPEFPLPIPIDDAFDVFKYIAFHPQKFNIDPNKIMMGGLSSGAHVAACISNLAKADPKLKILHQILLNGCYDLTCSTHDYDDYEKEDKMLTREAFYHLLGYWKIPQDDLDDPRFSPYFEKKFDHLPPTTVIVGEYDGVRNDSEAYYQKLKQHHVNVERILLPGQTHNAAILRAVMTDGEDPAKTMANIIKRYI
jgi:acetyl esterase